MMLLNIYKGKVKSSRSSLRKTWDKRPLGRGLDRSWCHHHTTRMIKLFWSQPMNPCTLTAAYGQGEKFSAKPRTDMKLKTTGYWIETRTGADVTVTLQV